MKVAILSKWHGYWSAFGQIFVSLHQACLMLVGMQCLCMTMHVCVYKSVNVKMTYPRSQKAYFVNIKILINVWHSVLLYSGYVSPVMTTKESSFLYRFGSIFLFFARIYGQYGTTTRHFHAVLTEEPSGHYTDEGRCCGVSCPTFLSPHPLFGKSCRCNRWI